MATNHIYERIGSLRLVTPYIHEFKTFAKGRWIGRELLDVVQKEFGGGVSAEYWETAIKAGQVKVNQKNVDKTYKIRDSDQLTHLAHRHEPPVVGDIVFVGETDEIIALCKPASMPVHPCGSYRYNSLTQILLQEPIIPQQPHLHLVHRLDRVTSGLMILAKSSNAAGKLSQQIRDKTTKKVYLARVKGKFPGNLSHLRQLDKEALQRILETEALTGDGDEEDAEIIHKATPSLTSTSSTTLTAATTVSTATMTDNKNSQQQSRVNYKEQRKRKHEQAATNKAASSSSSSSSISSPLVCETDPVVVGRSERVGYFVDNEDGSTDWKTGQEKSSSLTLLCPLSVSSYRDAVHGWEPVAGKQSGSIFRLLSYRAQDDTSLVECELITGRTHQLRLHLQLLGSPIANDPCYGGTLFFGEEGRVEQALDTLREMKRLNQEPISRVPSMLKQRLLEEENGSDNDNNNAEKKNRSRQFSDNQEGAQEQQQVAVNDLGFHCRFCASKSNATLERILHCDGIWLHALRFECQGFTFTAPPPDWATPFSTTE